MQSTFRNVNVYMNLRLKF
uniref:Uncharacterized protein n=1 Tax=Arundo donax TaxID=35708 RepID=A0A0A9B7D4_ARUDO